jgi:integrase
LIINPFLCFYTLGAQELGTKWGREMKPYRKPTIVDHDGDMTQQWYVYFKWWDEKNQKFVKAKRSKLPNGQAINRIDSPRERVKQIALLRDALELLLSKGWTPEAALRKEELSNKKPETPAATTEPTETQWTINEAIDEIIRIKTEYLSKFGLRGFKSKCNALKKYLADNNMDKWQPEQIKRKHMTEFLRHVKKTKGKDGAEASARTRNNYLIEIRGLFEKMIEEDILIKNPCKGITSLRESVTRHLSYSKEQMALMSEWMGENEPYLKMFSSFIGYAFLRPVEILRLQAKDIRGNEIYLKASDAKTDKSEVIPIIDKLKPIVEKLIRQAKSPDDYLFTTNQMPGRKQVYSTWFFSKRFKRCKDFMNAEHDSNFTDDNTLYAMRHTFIKDIYLHFKQTMSKEQAEFATMKITRHKSLSALRAYIRDYSIDIPEDWSAAYSIEY